MVLNVDGEEAAALIEKYPFYTAYDIPADTYPGMTEAATTVAVKATLIVADDLSEDLVYNLTKTLFENKAEVEAGTPRAASWMSTTPWRAFRFPSIPVPKSTSRKLAH